jgi:Ca-activated chloride channel family protein
MKRTLIILTLLALIGTVFPQKENKLLRQGNNKFEKGDYKEAEKDYRKALELNKESVKGRLISVLQFTRRTILRSRPRFTLI